MPRSNWGQADLPPKSRLGSERSAPEVHRHGHNRTVEDDGRRDFKSVTVCHSIGDILQGHQAVVDRAIRNTLGCKYHQDDVPRDIEVSDGLHANHVIMTYNQAAGSGGKAELGASATAVRIAWGRERKHVQMVAIMRLTVQDAGVDGGA